MVSISRRCYCWAGRASAQRIIALVLILLGSACFDSAPTENRDGYVGGRVLLAPGVGLAGAHIVIDQLDSLSDKVEIYRHIGEVDTDEQGYFEALPTAIKSGLISFRVAGGAYVDPVTNTRIQLDKTSELRAIHTLHVLEDRGRNVIITPIDGMVEARFRYEMERLRDPFAAYRKAAQHLHGHFGDLDWDRTVPADLRQAAVSPTDEVRAAFILGGLAVLADDARIASESTPQVVNLRTLIAAAVEDASDKYLDGNDDGDVAAGTGLELGECPAPAAACSAQRDACALGNCRPSCSVFSNTYRSLLSGAISKFIGTRPYPSVWNQTTLGSEDARTMLDNLARNADPELFNDTCLDTLDRIPPTVTWLSPRDGAEFLKGALQTFGWLSDSSG
jgi:hypothetical protein